MNYCATAHWAILQFTSASILKGHLVQNVNNAYQFSLKLDGVVVIALASHLRGPGSGHEWF